MTLMVTADPIDEEFARHRHGLPEMWRRGCICRPCAHARKVALQIPPDVPDDDLAERRRALTDRHRPPETR